VGKQGKGGEDKGVKEGGKKGDEVMPPEIEIATRSLP
jgi:hypothetical protein